MTKIHHGSITVLAVFWSLCMGGILLGGCGDDVGSDGTDNSNNSNTQVDLSVDEDTPANELTADEAAAVCGDIYDATVAMTTDMAASTEAYTCQAIGVTMAGMIATSAETDAEIVASCEEYLQSCENGEMDDLIGQAGGDEGSLDMTEEEFCADADESIADCEATAGELADCFVGMMAAEMSAYEAYMAQIPKCADLTAAYFDDASQMEEMPDDVATPAACEVVFEKCPTMAEDMAK